MRGVCADGQLQPCLDMEYTGAVHYQLVHQPGLSNCVFWQRRIISGGRLDDGAVVTRNETVVCLGGVHTCTLCAQETEPFIVHIVTQKHVSELMRTAVDNSATVHMAIVDYVRQLVAPYTFVQPQITLVVVGKQSRYKQEEVGNVYIRRVSPRLTYRSRMHLLASASIYVRTTAFHITYSDAPVTSRSCCASHTVLSPNCRLRRVCGHWVCSVILDALHRTTPECTLLSRRYRV
jgi:hypothetical protein